MCDYFGHTDLWSDVPPSKHLMAKFGTTLGRMTFCQMYPPGIETSWPSVVLLQAGWPLVRCTSPGNFSWPSVLLLWSDWSLVRCTPQAETSCGQVCYNIGQAEPLVTCTPTQRSGFGSGWHLVRLLVMLTFGQMYMPPKDIWVVKCDTTSGHCREKTHFVFICGDN